MIIHDINEEKFEDTLKEGIILVDFFATWCGPCKMLAPELENLSKDMKDLKIYKIDIDKYKSIAMRYRIMSVPTLLLYKDGKMVGNNMGYMPSSSLKEWIADLIK